MLVTKRMIYSLKRHFIKRLSRKYLKYFIHFKFGIIFGFNFLKAILKATWHLTPYPTGFLRRQNKQHMTCEQWRISTYFQQQAPNISTHSGISQFIVEHNCKDFNHLKRAFYFAISEIIIEESLSVMVALQKISFKNVFMSKIPLHT